MPDHQEFWQKQRFESILMHLDRQNYGLAKEFARMGLKEMRKTTDTETSSAPHHTTGPATRPCESFMGRPDGALLENLPATLERIRTAIMGCFKSTAYTPPGLKVGWIDSSTLQLTLRGATSSGENKAGEP